MECSEFLLESLKERLVVNLALEGQHSGICLGGEGVLIVGGFEIL